MNKLGIFMNFWEKKWDADHIKYVNKAADIGFDILEFQAQPLLDMSEQRMKDIKKAADDRGIELTYSLGLDPAYDVASADDKVRSGGIDYLKRIVERVGFMGGKVISGVSYAGWGVTDYILESGKEDILERSVDSMRQIIKTAEDNGVVYCVEAVNRFESVLINTAVEAVEYVKRVDSKNIGVLLDTYHMNIEENNIGDAIRYAGDYLVNFHTGENNRRAPGRGHIDWDEIFKALKDVDYKGRIVSEPFVMMGGEVGKDIKVWRNLDIPTEESIDAEAAFLLNFEKQKLQQYGLA
ncbi:MAG: sugar phosphate isomerase/epimerase family protein [Eubacteriales bacterium]|nr:sugar phosphate isomerase/epimerase family protein [Eubacteriales bacterium]